MICGIIRPTNPMGPVTETIIPVISETRIKIEILNFFTFIPLETANSSPPDIKISSFCNRSIITI